MQLIDQLKDAPPVIMDGALNTELSARGVYFNNVDWLRANTHHADIISDIHASYARAGARLHIANSFSCARHVTESFGIPEEFEAINRAAVTVCREAIDAVSSEPQWVAGSISTYAKDHDRRNLPELGVLEVNTRDQARILRDAGADMIALEMLFDVDHTLAMLRGAVSAGVPVSVGMVCAQSPDGEIVIQDKVAGQNTDRFSSFVKAVRDIEAGCPDNVDIVMTVMHSPFDVTDTAMGLLADTFDGPIGAYPNIGHYAPPGTWDISDAPSPEVFAEACQRWSTMGACFVGGCCGVGPAYIEKLG